jgi:hypothetical protein
MNSLTLKVLLTIYIFYVLLKFFEFFFRDEQTKEAGLRAVYVEGNGRIVRLFDNIVLLFALSLIGLLVPRRN